MKISDLIRFMLLHRATPLGSINCNHMNKLCLGDAVNVRELNEFWTFWRYWIGIGKAPPPPMFGKNSHILPYLTESIPSNS